MDVEACSDIQCLVILLYTEVTIPSTVDASGMLHTVRFRLHRKETLATPTSLSRKLVTVWSNFRLVQEERCNACLRC